MSNNPTILIIEDSETDRRLILEALKPLGDVEKVVSSSVDQSRGLFMKHSISAVILDLMLPGTTGYDSIRQLREIDPDVPIVVVTGMDSSDVRIQARASGIQHYMLKKDAFEGLALAVLGALDESRENSRSTTLIMRRLDSIFRLVDDQNKGVQQLYKAVFGNGKPGLADKVAQHDEAIDEMKRWRTTFDRIMWIAVSAAIVSIVGGLLSWAMGVGAK